MSARAESLANELAAATNEVTEFIDAVPDESWLAFCPGDQCTVAALICHIGNSYHGMLANVIQPVAETQSRPDFDVEALHAWNAQAAQQYAAATKDEARAILATHSAPAIDYVRNMTDEQLDTTFTAVFGPEPLSLESMVTGGLIGHPRGHLATARATAGLSG